MAALSLLPKRKAQEEEIECQTEKAGVIGSTYLAAAPLPCWLHTRPSAPTSNRCPGMARGARPLLLQQIPCLVQWPATFLRPRPPCAFCSRSPGMPGLHPHRGTLPHPAVLSSRQTSSVACNESLSNQLDVPQFQGKFVMMKISLSTGPLARQSTPGFWFLWFMVHV